MNSAQAKVIRTMSGLSFHELTIKDTAINGTEPKDATDCAFAAAASKVNLGFWECSPGVFKTARDGVNEVILVLEGKGTLVSDAGDRLDHEAGDMVLIPNGWRGAREIHEQFKKQYILISE
ncbi:cupin domain-containing protein [Pseudarthrobacter oxydans]|uniref:cupin domain-containing protein n=1 Tax=Pseudarthrobacter oxydans TaxID=1671 RepID=UPI00380C26C3